MEFPLKSGEWNFFDGDDFEAAEARDPGILGMELLAQVRPNGRIQDHFRIVLGGRQALDIKTSFGMLYGSSKYKDFMLKMQRWPRDIVIRRNSATSAWKNVYDLISERNASVVDAEDNPVPTETVLHTLNDEIIKGGGAASVRWAIVIGDDKTMRLDLTALPASEATIAARPVLKR